MERILLAFSLLVFSVNTAFPQTQNNQDVFVPISKYLEQGRADNLSAWFAENLELDVLGDKNSCSRNQAKQILRNFFVNYTPKSFDVLHRSGVYPMSYAIGLLDGGGNKFRVTIFVKTTDTGNYIQQLTIEKE
jgi:hypothetical protein